MTSMLDSFYQEDVTDTGARLSVRPTQEMAIIKHDARTGMMSIIVPDKDENDSNARNSEITITKVDFVPLTVVKIEKGKGIGSNATIRDTFDLYKYSDNGQSESIGVVNHDGAYQKVGAKTNWRLVGVLRSVDGKPVKDLGNALSEKFGSNLVPVYMDLTNAKNKELAKSDSRSATGKVLSVSGGKTGVTIQHTTQQDYPLPKFEVTELDEASTKKFEKFIEPFTVDLSTWIEDIRANDEFLALVQTMGFIDAGMVNKLRSAGLSTASDLENKLKELGQDDLAKGASILLAQFRATGNGGNGTATASSNAGFSGTNDATAQSANTSAPAVDPFATSGNGENTEIDISDDDLPF